MKVKDLLNEIYRNNTLHPDFLEWDVYTEQLDEIDKERKRRDGWKTEKGSDEWEYFKCEGFYGIWKEKKIFTINVNY